MKKIKPVFINKTNLIIVTMFSICILLQNCVRENDHMIKTNRVSIYDLENSETSILKRLKDKEYKEAGGNDWLDKKRIEVYEEGEKTLTLLFYDNRLTGILVHSDKYYTPEGVKVGDTAQEMVDKGYKIWSVTEGDDALHVLTSKKDMKFYFTKSISSYNEIGKNAQLKMICIGSDY